MNEVPLSLEEAAILMEVSCTAIRSAIKSGRLKATRNGNRWEILLSDLQNVTFRAPNGSRGAETRRQVDEIEAEQWVNLFAENAAREQAEQATEKREEQGSDSAIPACSARGAALRKFRNGSAAELQRAIACAMDWVHKYRRPWYVCRDAGRWIVSERVVEGGAYLEFTAVGAVHIGTEG
ncbi:MAG: hypothetical protein QM758_11080 [Armatimonas sp.]